MADSEKYLSPFEGGEVDEGVEYSLELKRFGAKQEIEGLRQDVGTLDGRLVDLEEDVIGINTTQNHLVQRMSNVEGGKADKTSSGEQKLSDSSDRFLVTDRAGNVIAYIDQTGVNAASYNIRNADGQVIGTLDASFITAFSGFKNTILTREPDGLYVCDAAGNVCMKIDRNGVFDVKSIGDNLREALGTDDEDKIPSYLDEEYDKTLKTVQGLSDTDTFSFGFMTDLHFCNEDSTYDKATITNLRAGVKNAMSALRKMSREYPLLTVVMNGDYQQHPVPNTKQMGIDCLMDVNKWMAGMDAPCIALCGNHEHSYSGGNLSTTNYGLTRTEIYNYLSRKYVKGGIIQAGERVFYQIDDAARVVFVYISTTGAVATLGTSYSSVASIESDLKTAYDKIKAANTNNYPYILFSHYCIDVNDSQNPVTASVNGNVGITIDYFKTDGGSVIAFIGGHCHSDWVRVHNETVVISCLQSGLWTNVTSQDDTTYAHTVKTSTESAFSIFTVNKTTKKIYCTRFGLGKDRSIYYTNVSGAIGAVTFEKISAGNGSGTGTIPIA